jgi:hypothetical protein
MRHGMGWYLELQRFLTTQFHYVNRCTSVIARICQYRCSWRLPIIKKTFYASEFALILSFLLNTHVFEVTIRSFLSGRSALSEAALPPLTLHAAAAPVQTTPPQRHDCIAATIIVFPASTSNQSFPHALITHSEHHLPT